MVKPLKLQLSLIILFVICQLLIGQNCDYVSMENLRQESTLLLTKDNPSIDALQSMKDNLEETLLICAKEEFPGKDTLEYHYLENLIEICGLLADFEGKVEYLRRIEHSIQSEKYSKIDEEIAFIERDYGPLRIRFEGEVINEMATLKTAEGEEVTINILPPANAWEYSNKSNREQKLRRLNYLREQSLKGNLKVFFDSYDSEVGYFYFELPYVPYLERSNNSEDWYAITFDKKKRYRTNFSRPTPREPTPLLIIKPEDNWVLEVSIPDKWVKLSFPNLKQRLKFEDRQNGTILSSAEYIRIEKGKSNDYYLPSDRNIDIVFPERGQSLWNYFNKILYGGLFITLCYFVYTGAS